MRILDYLRKYYDNYYDLNVNTNHIITKVTDYSKDVSKGCVFVNLSNKDNYKYIHEAISLGAKTIITTTDFKEKIKGNINVIKVKNPKVDLARLLKIMYFKKHYKMPITIGVSGTCGKTTVSTLLYQSLKKLNKDVLLISSNGVFSYFAMNEKKFKTQNTTPSITKIYKYLVMNQLNYDYLILEVSSQGISESRVLGIDFDYSILTNFNKEHLEYHKTVENYKNAKAGLVYNTKRILFLYEDIEEFDFFYKLNDIKKITYGFNNASFKINIISSTLEKTLFKVTYNSKEYLISTNLVGEFNVLNITVVFALLMNLDINLKDILNVINDLDKIDGRMNVFEKDGVKIIVDYAHSTLATINVLNYLNKIKTNRLIAVFGVGGNRDKEKRSYLGSLVCENSDLVIFTEDNSRSEKLTDILNDLTKTLVHKNYIIEENRKKAIELAIESSCKGDIVAILGKGNENKIISSSSIREFSDLEFIKKYVKFLDNE